MAMVEISGALFTSFLPKFRQLPFFPKLHGFAATSGAAYRRTRCSISAEPMPAGASSPTIPWGCEIESLESAFALKQWLSESGLPPQKMDIRRVDVGGRGLVAHKSIRKGEKLLFVPPSLVITADSVCSLNLGLLGEKILYELFHNYYLVNPANPDLVNLVRIKI